MAEVADSWSENHTKRLAKLLGHEADGYEAGDSDGLFLVVPRLGTISPWSSKATDIAGLCGLDALKRIERGIAYTVSGISHALHADCTALLHDRMTESVLQNTSQLSQLFAHHQPQPLVSIDILADGKPALEAANRDMGLALA